MCKDAKLCSELKFTTTSAPIWLNKSGKGGKFEHRSMLLDSLFSSCFWTTRASSSRNKPAGRRAAFTVQMGTQPVTPGHARASPLPPFTQQPKHSQELHPKGRRLQRAAVHDFCCTPKNWRHFLLHLVDAVLMEQKTRAVGRLANTRKCHCLTVTPHWPFVSPLFYPWLEFGCQSCKSRYIKALTRQYLCYSCFWSSALLPGVQLLHTNHPAHPWPPACLYVPPHQAAPKSLFGVSSYCHKNLLLQTSVCFLDILYWVLIVYLKTVTHACFRTLQPLHSEDISINSTYNLFYGNIYHPERVVKTLTVLQFSTHKRSRLKFGNRKVCDTSRLPWKYRVNTGQHTTVPELHSYINDIFLLVVCLKSFSSAVSTTALTQDLPPTFKQHHKRGLNNCLSRTELLFFYVLISRGKKCCPLIPAFKFRS